MDDPDKAIDTFIPDALPEPAQQKAVTPRRSSIFPAIAGGAIAAALGFGAAQFVPDGWPLQSTTALQEAVAAQESALTDARAEIARLGTALAAVEGRPAADPALEQRIAVLEAAPAPDNAALLARIASVEQALAAVSAMPADGSAATPAAIAAQAAALAALQADVAALKTASNSTPDISAVAAQLAGAEARTALRQIAVALETGGPFESALAPLDGTPLPQVLATNAATGLPTLADLQASFPDVARAGLDAALRADMGEGWTDRVTSFLRSQTGARSTSPREGDDPDAILSRAEAALSAGTVTESLALIATLPDAAQAEFAAWATTANTYLDGQAALATLTASLGGQNE